MRPAEEKANEPEASAMDSRSPLFQSISVFSLLMLHTAVDEYLSEGGGINLSLISEVLSFILMQQDSFFFYFFKQAFNVF